MEMKSIFRFTLVLVLLGMVSSCWTDKSKPNYQYMPDMYKSVGYETYSENPNFDNGMTTQLPAEGTIARGHVPYEYENSEEVQSQVKYYFHTHPIKKERVYKPSF